MVDVSFELNGRKVNPNNIGNALESAVLKSVSDSIKKSVGSLHCNEHNQQAKVLVKGKNIDNLSFTISGCCDNFINKVTNKIV